MIENNQNNIKYATNRDQINLAINRSVVESFTSILKNKNKNENENYNKINTNITNNTNIQNINKVNIIPSYSLCPQLNFYLSSHIKHFDLPLSISNSSLNYLIKLKNKENKDNNKDNNENIEVKTIPENKEESSIKKNYTIISNSNIFIGGGQNMKAMRIHLSHNKNNTFSSSFHLFFIVSKEVNN